MTGEDRYETAILTAQSFSEANRAIIVDGENFPDALSASALLIKERSPILLMSTRLTDERVLEELKRLQVKEITVLGGGFDKLVLEKLKEIAPVTVIKGGNRYTTNRAVNEEIFKEDVTKIVVASGEEFSDAISGMAVALKEKLPLVLTSRQGLELRDIKTRYPKLEGAYVLGGEKCIEKVALEYLPNPERIAGRTRYETSEKVGERFFKEAKRLVLTKGLTFPNPLAAINLIDEETRLRLFSESLKHLPFKGDITVIGDDLVDDRVMGTFEPKDRPLAIYINPHQDDETVFLGLQLIRDYKAGKEIHILQATNGNMTSTIHVINDRLKKEGIDPITDKEIVLSRNAELEESLSVLGVDKKHIHYSHMDERVLNIDTLYPRLVSLINRYPNRPIELRTVTMDYRYDFSRGKRDHSIAEQVQKLYQKNFPERVKDAKWFVGFWKKDGAPKGYIEHIATKEELLLWREMAKGYSYDRWNPEKNRYAVGAHSIGYLFTKLRDAGVFYEKP